MILLRDVKKFADVPGALEQIAIASALAIKPLLICGQSIMRKPDDPHLRPLQTQAKTRARGKARPQGRMGTACRSASAAVPGEVGEVSVSDGFRFGVGFVLAGLVTSIMGACFWLLMGMDDKVGIYTDPLTGCQYVTPLFNHGFQPRVDASGNHICIPPP